MENTVAFIQTFWSRSLHYKALRIRNLREMDRFHSKLVPFLLAITNTLAWTKTQAYCDIHTL